MLVDPNTGDERTFTFDYSFWSHDGFRTDENGIYVPTSPKYADQNVVYEALGKQVLDNAWEGYNCCLFAYGQTGSGKSYSMVSSHSHSCQVELLTRNDEEDDAYNVTNNTFNVCV